MRKLLLSKGFVYNDYEYKNENFYVYEGENGSESTKRLATIFGFTDNGTDEDLLVCCDEYFTEFVACCYGQEFHYNKDEFVEFVGKM